MTVMYFPANKLTEVIDNSTTVMVKNNNGGNGHAAPFRRGCFRRGPAILPPFISVSEAFHGVSVSVIKSLSFLEFSSSVWGVCICTFTRSIRQRLTGEIVDWAQLTAASDPDLPPL